jgi:CheY-like chemotaxis protein
MDGLTAIKEIRQREIQGVLSKQLVIALTGNARPAQIDEARKAGMDDGGLFVLYNVSEWS